MFTGLVVQQGILYKACQILLIQFYLAFQPNKTIVSTVMELKWCSSRKKTRCTESSQRRVSSGLTQSSNGSSSKDDFETSIDCQIFLSPNNLVFDNESCKYQVTWIQQIYRRPSLGHTGVKIILLM